MKNIYFAIPKGVLNDMPVSSVLDILRYEGARPLSNGPQDWYTFEKAAGLNSVTMDRLNSFGIRNRDVMVVRADVKHSGGSCPAELRDAIERAQTPDATLIQKTPPLSDRGKELKEIAGDILTTAVEGGSTYWAEVTRIVFDEDKSPSCADFLDVEAPGAPATTITRPMIIAAVRLIASGEIFPLDRDIVASCALALAGRADGGEFDQPTADVVVQVALWGKVIYG